MELLKERPAPPTTNAAEGLPRRPWTLTDIKKMMAAGIIGEHERFELIGGEIVPMSPKGVRHETLKMDLNRFWAKRLSHDLNMLTETTLYVTETEFREPDFVFWPRSILVKDLKPAVIQLLVEVADSSSVVRYDRQGARLCRLRHCRVLGRRRRPPGHPCSPGAGGWRLSAHPANGPEGVAEAPAAARAVPEAGGPRR